MLIIRDQMLPAAAQQQLNVFQASVDALADYADRVEAAASAWKTRTSTVKGEAAFKAVRATLAQMCIGPIRCAYCEDSLADEVEHIKPKSFFPDLAFVWANYAFACGPCNGPKGSRYAVVSRGTLREVVRTRGLPPAPAPAGRCALIDPRTEDPTEFLELDLGGVGADGTQLDPTFDFLPKEDLSATATARAEYTIKTLGLNREVLRKARSNAFGGFRARLREYAEKMEAGADVAELARLRDDLLGTPHLTVLHEMRVQRLWLPEIDDLLNRAPEASMWPLVIP
ncbi:hypothetical protein ACNI65_20380 [Roseateles sp. So40a]|uniref:hypothetical protein n=1 Tax=Roseateles sp. So40a TaxID=3400226 RepID=UPI003A84D884